MPPEIAALIDKPILLAAVLFAGAMIGIYLEKFASWERRRKWREKNGARRNGKVLQFQPKRDPVPRQAPDAVDQLRTVMRAEFNSRMRQLDTASIISKIRSSCAPPSRSSAFMPTFCRQLHHHAHQVDLNADLMQE